MADNPWKTLCRKLIYKSDFLTLREDEVVRPDGKNGIYNVITSGRSIIVIPITDDGQFYIIGQWRYPTGRYSWEFPGGRIDDKEDLVETGRRELLEEAGLVARSWKNLGFLDLLSGDHDDVFDVLLAQGVERKENDQVNADCIDRVRAVTPQELMLTMGREIKNAQSLAALMLYLSDPEVMKKYLRA